MRRFTRDEARDLMRRQNVSEAAIEKALNREYGELAAAVTPVAQPMEFPIRITLPWSALCSDNNRERALVVEGNGKPYPKKAMTGEYKAAREKVIMAGRRAMGDFAPLDRPLELVARVFLPAQRRVDIVNFAKGVHDALNKIVYTDDHLLHDVRWVRAGSDVDAPRVEIEVRPL